MAQYWYAFLVPGVGLYIAAAIVQLLNLRSIFKGGADAVTAAGSEDDGAAFKKSVKSTGKRLFGGFVVVIVLGVLGTILTAIGIITLVVHLLR